MALQTVTCPQCRTRLGTDQPIPTGVTLNCPDCKATFPAQTAEVGTPVPVRLIGPGFVLAVSASILLGASIIVAAAVLSRPAASDVASSVPADTDRQKLDAERRRLEKERQALAEQKRTVEHARLLLAAAAALREENYAKAKRLYNQALAVIPTDSEATAGLAKAQAALAAAKKTGEAEKERQAQVEHLLAEARTATEKKQLAHAVRLLESARTLAPSSQPVLAALAAAREGLEADAAQKQALADFRRLMDAAGTALRAEQFTDALRDYRAALRLMPDDLEAQQGVKRVETKLAGAADRERRQQALENFLDRARKAQADRRFKDAVAAAESALGVVPNDRDATRLLRAAQDALREAKSKNAKLLVRTEDALRLGRVEEARRLADEAVKNWPEDPRAGKMLARLDTLLRNSQTVRATFLRYMQQGALARAMGRNADAVAACTGALRLVPADPDAMRLLRAARLALDRDLKGGDYDRLVKLGDAALGRNAFGDAVRAYSGALKIIPDDPVATAGLSKARYGKAMADGRQALRLKRKADAVRAFEAALAEVPDDPLAAARLRKAQLLR